jgi:hypothetical protein
MHVINQMQIIADARWGRERDRSVSRSQGGGYKTPGHGVLPRVLDVFQILSLPLGAVLAQMRKILL